VESARAAAPLVERERELAVIGEALSRARTGSGGMVLIEGAAGLGKSRLLSEAVALGRSAEMCTLRAGGSEPEREFAFGVVLQLFEPTLAGDSADREALFAGAAGLARPVFELRDPEPLGGRTLFSLLHGLHWLAANLAERAPLVLCVDDLHWCDDPSTRYVTYLLRRLEELPIVVLGCTRPLDRSAAGGAWDELVGQSAIRHLPLAPLTTAGVTQLVHARLSPDADASFCEACSEATGGNPFFLGEVLHAFDDEGLEPSPGGTERLRHLEIDSVSRSVLFRLVRMGEDAVALARALVVLGDRAALRHAAAVARLDPDRTARAADRLAAADILAPGEPLSFSHPLVRASVRGDLTPAGRGSLDLRAARVLADELAPPEVIGGHLLAAPATGEPWVVSALRDAARLADTRGAPESAARYLARALEEPPGPGERSAVLVEFAMAEAAGGGPEAVRRCTQALEHVEDTRDRVRVRQTLGRVLAAHGEERLAARAFATALEDLGDQNPEGLRTELLADYLSAAVLDLDLRTDALARADDLDSSELSASGRGERALLAQLAVRSGQRGDPSETTIALARRAWHAGALLADEGPAGQSWVLVYWALGLAEDYATAEQIADGAVQQAQRLGVVLAHATAVHWRADCCLRQGRLSDALADVERAIDAQQFGWRRYLAMAYAIRADALREQGQLEEAEQALALAAGAEEQHMLQSAPRVRVAAARLDLARHRYAEAYAALVEIGHVVERDFGVRRTVLAWRAYAALAALQSGNPDRARELIAPELELAKRAQVPVSLGRALRIAGLIDGGERGLELLAGAVTQLRATPASLELAHALVDLGAALRRGARRSESRAPLEEGLKVALRCGALPLAERAGEEISAGGARPRSAPRGGGSTLTPSEQRVARMAADGLTNQEIAQALFVTGKTIEFHLRHVFQKLGISSRRQLRTALPPA
jgi:DNA-binding CsgD family transcriptional regulator/tetratricopeptide (TPR) repeat protein